MYVCLGCSMPGCYLKSKCCQVFASVLCSDSQLRQLDLSRNDLQDLGVQLLSVGLGSSRCRLETLRYWYSLASWYTVVIQYLQLLVAVQVVVLSFVWIRLLFSTGCHVVGSQKKVVPFWPQLWGPTRPIWESWTSATITLERQEWGCSRRDSRTQDVGWKNSS